MTVILILAVLALVLGLLEIFIFPGFGISGIGAIACAIADVVLIYQDYGLGWAASAVGVAVAVLALLLYIVARSKTVDRMALHTSINSTNATREQLSVRPGDTGKALTRLALVGNAEINGTVVEVKSAGAFIDSGTAVRVVRVNEANITVEAC